MTRYFLIAFAALFIASPAEARHHRHHHRHPVIHRTIDRLPVHAAVQPSCDSNRFNCGPVGSPVVRVTRPERVDVAASAERVVGHRRAGFPYAFCGAEASLYVFGETKRELWLAANWIHKFPRTSPAPGMAAARNHHVMVLISHVGGSDWLVHDGNSGGHLTREHVRSISGYVIVDPHGARYASRT